MQYLHLTEKQVSTLQDQIRDEYYTGESLAVANLMIDPDVSGHTKGALALVHTHIIPFDDDSRYQSLSQWDAFQVELIELPGITFAITKMHLVKLQRFIDDYAGGLITKQEMLKKVLESHACIVKFG